jgi:hypothetical protein
VETTRAALGATPGVREDPRDVPTPSAPELADAAADAVRAIHDQAEAEQPHHGIDSFDERAFQQALAVTLDSQGFEVEREVRYPVHGRREKRSEGFRCDFVVGPAGDAPWWVELKTVAQFSEAGVNRRFRSVLQRAAVDDVVKLACDPQLPRRAVLLVLHTQSEQIGDEGVLAFAHRCADEGLPIEVPRVRHVALLDRLGNRDCSVALVPVGDLSMR